MSTWSKLPMTRRVSQVALVAGLLLVGVGCMPFPRWSYLAETRLEAGASSDGFSADEIGRAQVVAAELATQVGMQPSGELEEDMEIEKMRSAGKKPPRRFLSLYYGRMKFGLPIELCVEVSEDGRSLYFSLSDYERGTPSPTVTRIRNLMMARVESAFPDASTVHEANALGPFFDLHP